MREEDSRQEITCGGPGTRAPWECEQGSCAEGKVRSAPRTVTVEALSLVLCACQLSAEGQTDGVCHLVSKRRGLWVLLKMGSALPVSFPLHIHER